MAAERKYEREEWCSKICDRLANGETLSAICRDLDIPRRTVNEWRLIDESIAEQFRVAREEFIESHADACLEIADSKNLDQGAVQRDKLRVWTRLQLIARCDNAKKSMQKENPEVSQLNDPNPDV